jgi:broad specificity phosphatase PhoE
MPEWDSPSTSSDVLNSYSPSSVLSKLGRTVMYIVRHCEIKQDKQKLVRGLSNQSLDEQGKEDAKKVAKFFSDIEIGGVVTDDMSRTKETALPIALEKDKELQMDPYLRSWHLGAEIEGEPIDEVDEQILDLKNHPEKLPVGGESYAEFSAECEESFNKYLSRSMSGLPWVMVTHGSFIQVIFEYLGEKIDQSYHSIPVGPGGIVEIQLTRDGFKPKVLDESHIGE